MSGTSGISPSGRSSCFFNVAIGGDLPLNAKLGPIRRVDDIDGRVAEDFHNRRRNEQQPLAVVEENFIARLRIIQREARPIVLDEQSQPGLRRALGKPDVLAQGIDEYASENGLASSVTLIIGYSFRRRSAPMFY